MTLHWIRVGPKANECPQQRQKRTRYREGNVNMEAEAGVMNL